MSYDLSISVKVAGCSDDVYAKIAEPEYSSPTYNLGKMFRACMDWDYRQGEHYPCEEVLQKVEKGIKNLTIRRDYFIRYNPPNGWGSIDSAKIALESLRECILKTAEDIPIEALYMSW